MGAHAVRPYAFTNSLFNSTKPEKLLALAFKKTEIGAFICTQKELFPALM